MMSHEQRCSCCKKVKRYSCFSIDDRGGQGKTCIKCRINRVRDARTYRETKAAPAISVLPVNSGLSEEQLDDRLKAAIKKAASNHNATWTPRY